MTEMGKKILGLPVKTDLPGVETVRDYLVALLDRLWAKGEGFSGKRPFGNSGWEDDLRAPIVRAGLADGTIDESGYLASMSTAQESAIDNLIFEAIDTLGETGAAEQQNQVTEAGEKFADTLARLNGVLDKLNERIDDGSLGVCNDARYSGADGVEVWGSVASIAKVARAFSAAARVSSLETEVETARQHAGSLLHKVGRGRDDAASLLGFPSFEALKSFVERHLTRAGG